MLLVSLLGVSAGMMHNESRLVLDATIDENWRGAFDLLVLPRGQRLGLEDTQGLVEPNYLGFTGQGGITLDQLRRISQVDGVGLAAPVMTVGVLRHQAPAPTLLKPGWDSTFTPYQIDITSRVNDGISERLLQTESGQVVVGPIEPGTSFEDLGGTGPPLLTGWNSTWGLDWLELGFAPLPPAVGLVLAVDPDAEAELLGPSAEFLTLLSASAPMERTIGTFDTNLVPSDLFPAEVALLESASGERDGVGVVPLVVSDRLYAKLSIEVRVQRGSPLEGMPTTLERLPEDLQWQTLPPVRLDASHLLRPFTAPSLMLPWPGTNIPAELGNSFSFDAPTMFQPSLVGRPSYTPTEHRPGSTAPTFAVLLSDVVTSDGTPVANPTLPDPSQPDEFVRGTEAAYRPLTLLGGRPFPPLYAPLGVFNLEDIDLPDNPLNYVPLGAYDPPNAVWVADPEGRAVAPVSMLPTMNPVGLLGSTPLAFTDLAGGEALRGEVSIDAVRVRIDDIDGFTEAARERIKNIGAVITDLGVDVTVVAGSSPQPVDIYVPGYYPDRAGAESDLGWVTQRWTTIGAAERVQSAFGAVNTVLLGLALAAGTVFIAGASLVRQATRVEEVSVQEVLGWSRARSRRWIFAEGVVAAVLVAFSGLAVVTVTGRSPALLLAVLLLAAAFPLAALVAWLVVQRGQSKIPISGAETSIRPRATPAVTTPWRYGVRRLVATPMRHVAIVANLTTAGIASGVAVAWISDAQEQSGPTFLSLFTGEVLRAHHLAILAVTVVGSVMLTMILYRFDTDSRRDEWISLTASGYPWRSIVRSRSVQALVSAFVAAAVSATVTWIVAVVTAPTGVARAVPTAMVVPVVASLVAWMTTQPRRLL